MTVQLGRPQPFHGCYLPRPTVLPVAAHYGRGRCSARHHCSLLAARRFVFASISKLHCLQEDERVPDQQRCFRLWHHVSAVLACILAALADPFECHSDFLVTLLDVTLLTARILTVY